MTSVVVSPFVVHRLNQVVRQQEIRNPLLHGILMLTHRTHQLPLTNLCVHKNLMQLLDHQFILLKLFWRWCGLWEWDVQLFSRQLVLSNQFPTSSLTFGWAQTYLVTNNLQRLPIQAWKQINKELGVDLEIVLDELAFFWVQRKGSGGGFAGFDSAGEKVEGENLHGCCYMKKWWWDGTMVVDGEMGDEVVQRARRGDEADGDGTFLMECGVRMKIRLDRHF